MKIFAIGLAVLAVGASLFFIFGPARTVSLDPGGSDSFFGIKEGEISSETDGEDDDIARDIEKQVKLANPPSIIKAIYATGWSAGSEKKRNYLIDLINRTELNAIVVDVKDYSGFISYEIDNDEIKATGALAKPRILRPNALIKKLHDNGIYVIARVSVFQDPILAAAHPEWALKNGTSTELWRDNKGLAWMDAASKEVWDYNALIAKDAFERGFDEVNFDYIRFPSDGDLNAIGYPYWDGTTPLNETLREFFKYLRENFPDDKISADLFGLATVDYSDLGIGQIIEDAFLYFDYVAPMVYPSHYGSWTFGYEKPALEPYGVVGKSIETAMYRLIKLGNKEVVVSGSGTSTVTSTIAETENLGKLRPWLQDFDLGADYTAERVRAQIESLNDVFCGRGLRFPPSPETSTEPVLFTRGEECDFSSSKYGKYYNGWMLWNPANIYTAGALTGE